MWRVAFRRNRRRGAPGNESVWCLLLDRIVLQHTPLYKIQTQGRMRPVSRAAEEGGNFRSSPSHRPKAITAFPEMSLKYRYLAKWARPTMLSVLLWLIPFDTPSPLSPEPWAYRVSTTPGLAYVEILREEQIAAREIPDY